MTRKFKAYVGIDVSKQTLDICLLKDGIMHSFRSENSLEGLKALFRAHTDLKALKRQSTIYCFEQMGFYNNHLYAFLEHKKAAFSVQIPLHLKKSMGLVRGKSDKIDAQRIALFTSKNAELLKLWVRPREIILQLKALSAQRRRLLIARAQLRVPLNESTAFVSKGFMKLAIDTSSNTLAALSSDLKKIEALILKLIREDESLNHLFQVITSVNYIGEVIAVSLIIATNEFKNFDNAKQFASYAGIAPFTYQSGTSLDSKGHISFFGNKDIKTLLHLAAVGSMRYDEELRDYYRRKVAEGKHGLVVLNAVRNKIVKRIFTCVKEDRMFIRTPLIRTAG